MKKVQSSNEKSESYYKGEKNDIYYKNDEGYYHKKHGNYKVN